MDDAARKPVYITIPTALTLFRILLLPVMVIVFYAPFHGANIAAALIFMAAAITATADPAVVADAAAVVIAVPTPLSPQREPDLSAIERAAASIATHLRKGHLVVLDPVLADGAVHLHDLRVVGGTGHFLRAEIAAGKFKRGRHAIPPCCRRHDRRHGLGSGDG